MNNTCDILNSKSKFGKGYKGPLKKASKDSWMTHLDITIQYLSTLSDVSGIPLISTRKTTGFLGVIISIKSFERIFEMKAM